MQSPIQSLLTGHKKVSLKATGSKNSSPSLCFFDCLPICERDKKKMKEPDIGTGKGTGDSSWSNMEKVSLRKQLLGVCLD